MVVESTIIPNEEPVNREGLLGRLVILLVDGTGTLIEVVQHRRNCREMKLLIGGVVGDVDRCDIGSVTGL
jgi:hypothetical protein